MTSIYTHPALNSYIRVDEDGVGMAIDHYVNDELKSGTYLQGDDALTLQDQLDDIFDLYDGAHAERVAWDLLTNYV